MRIRINLNPITDRIVLPLHYNHLLQAFIYRNLSKTLSSSLHQKGSIIGKRRFKLFTFSRLFGKFKREGDGIVFTGPLHFWLSSPMIKLLESLASHLVKKSKIKLGKSYLHLTGIEVGFVPEMKGEVLVRTLSPITVYSTLKSPEGRKKTYYYSPFEEDFSKLIKENLCKKYLLIHKRPLEGSKFSISPEKVSQRNHHILFYKGTVIKAWSGIYKIRGSEELIRIAYETGLGSKNSQGFGMIELLLDKADKMKNP